MGFSAPFRAVCLIAGTAFLFPGTVLAAPAEDSPGPLLDGSIADVADRIPATVLDHWILGRISSSTYRNGPVAIASAVVKSGGRVYIGGDFNYVGPRRQGMAFLSADVGRLLKGFEDFNGTIHVIIPDGSGGWYLGGRGVWYEGQDGLPLRRIESPCVFHVDEDGELIEDFQSLIGVYFLPESELDPNDAENGVNALVLTDDTLYVGGMFKLMRPSPGGGFTWTEGDPVNLVALDAKTGAARPVTFNPDGPVNALVLSSGRLYAGGSFKNVGTTARKNLAAFDSATGALLSWDPGTDQAVECLAASGATIFVGGQFTSFGGSLTAPSTTHRVGIGALDAVTGDVLPWSADTADCPVTTGCTNTRYVHALNLSGGTLYVGGNFIEIGGQVRQAIAALDAATASVLSWNPAFSVGDVYSLAVDADTVYAGGWMQVGPANDFIGQHLASLDKGTAALKTNFRHTDGWVTALALDKLGRLLAGGSFRSAGGFKRWGMAALDAETGMALENWVPHVMGGAVQDLALSGDTLFLGGGFAVVDNQPRIRLAALDAETGSLKPWNPGADQAVSKIAVSDGVVYAAGAFITLGGSPSAFLRALDAETGGVLPFNAGVFENRFSFGAVLSELLPLDGKLYVCGSFDHIAGEAHSGIAVLDAVTGAVLPWNPQPDGQYVNDMAASGGRLYVCGVFTTIGGEERYGLAEFDLTTGLVTPWNPRTSGITLAGSPIQFSSLTQNPVLSNLAVGDDLVFATGGVSGLEGNFSAWVGAFKRGDGELAYSASPWTCYNSYSPMWGCSSGEVDDLFFSDKTLYMAGTFQLGSHGYRPAYEALYFEGDAPRARAARSGEFIPYPNPHRIGGSPVLFSFEPCARGSVVVLDRAFNPVRSLPPEWVDAASGHAQWDGFDGAGRAAPPGMYYAILETEKGRLQCKLTVAP